MESSIVERLHSEFRDLLVVLDDASEISLRSTADENFRKALLLAASSYFERIITGSVLSFVSSVSNGNPLVTNLVRNKAVSRQYHTWFNWDGKNANQFYGLFGKEFKTHMENRIDEDDDLDQAVRAFLEIGRDRNRLVHQDFGAFTLEKTSEEIFQLYRKAKQFVDEIPKALQTYTQSLGGPG